MASESDSSDSSQDSLKEAQVVLKKVYEYLQKDSMLSLDALLDSTGISADSYIKALRYSSNGTNIVLKREPHECTINPYNSDLMRAWQANMDIQFIIDAYACVMYVASYMMKNERGMCELLKQVGRQSRNDDIAKQLRHLGSAFLHNREVSTQEAAYRLLSIPMKQLSRSVVFLNTNVATERISVLKPQQHLEMMHDEDEDVFHKSMIDRYIHRPLKLESMFCRIWC